MCFNFEQLLHTLSKMSCGEHVPTLIDAAVFCLSCVLLYKGGSQSIIGQFEWTPDHNRK